MGEIIVKIQAGKDRQAAYGDKVLTQLSKDLNQKYGKGFSDIARLLGSDQAMGGFKIYA